MLSGGCLGDVVVNWVCSYLHETRKRRCWILLLPEHSSEIGRFHSFSILGLVVGFGEVVVTKEIVAGCI